MLSWYQAQLDDTNNTQHTKITVQAASSIMNSTHDTTPPLDTASTPSYRRTTSLFFVFFSPLLCFMNQQLRIECWLCSTPNLTTMIQLPTLSQHIDSLFLPQIPAATSTKPPGWAGGRYLEKPSGALFSLNPHKPYRGCHSDINQLRALCRISCACLNVVASLPHS